MDESYWVHDKVRANECHSDGSQDCASKEETMHIVPYSTQLVSVKFAVVDKLSAICCMVLLIANVGDPSEPQQLGNDLVCPEATVA
jgi:hypothetical protein